MGHDDEISVVATITLKRGREKNVLARHPWIFSGAIERTKGKPQEGDLVEVLSSAGARVGIGHFGQGSIAVKVISFGEAPWSKAMLDGSLRRAYALREALGLLQSQETNAYRLVNGEGDFLPGLIVDAYANTLVLQCHSWGMYRLRDQIVDVLMSCLGSQQVSVYDRSADTLDMERKPADVDEPKNSYLCGSAREVFAREDGLEYEIDVREGQKTGFFLDQRDNRRALREHSQGKKVLNAFCYSGGFSVSAFAGGARFVRSVDVSKKAAELAERNVRRNFPNVQHEAVAADCFDYLREIETDFDVIVLDPPAFAKHRGAVDGALRGYRSINAEAMKRIAQNGFLLSFSCSQLVDEQQFASVLWRAALDAKRDVQVLRQFGASACHPRSIFHAEGRYLKGALLRISGKSS